MKAKIVNYGGVRKNGRNYLKMHRGTCPNPIIPYKTKDVTEYLRPKKKIERASEIAQTTSMDGIILSRPFKTVSMDISTSPRIILRPPHPTAYLISNPSLSVGLTTSHVFFSGTQSAAGNTQASPLGVANYMKMHFHMNVTAVTGDWDIVFQTRDPNSGNWADSQVIFSNITSVGTYYASIGDFGLVVDAAIRWIPNAAGSITFSVTGTLKDGAPGAGSGLARSIFLGDRNVTPESGYPLFEGQNRIFYLGDEVELWAVSLVDTSVKVFLL